jgi:hypothetical protein
MYTAIYKEVKDNPHSSIMESGQENVSKAEGKKHNAERETETLEMSAPTRNRRSHLQCTETYGR